jgi:hypothetical protein
MIDFLDFENFHDELFDGVHLLRVRFVPLIPSGGSSFPFTWGFCGRYKVVLLGVNSDTWSYKIGSQDEHLYKEVFHL